MTRFLMAAVVVALGVGGAETAMANGPGGSRGAVARTITPSTNLNRLTVNNVNVNKTVVNNVNVNNVNVNKKVTVVAGTKLACGNICYGVNACCNFRCRTWYPGLNCWLVFDPTTNTW